METYSRRANCGGIAWLQRALQGETEDGRSNEAPALRSRGEREFLHKFFKSSAATPSALLRAHTSTVEVLVVSNGFHFVNQLSNEARGPSPMHVCPKGILSWTSILWSLSLRLCVLGQDQFQSMRLENGNKYTACDFRPCKAKNHKSRGARKSHRAGDRVMQCARCRDVDRPRNAWGILTEQAQVGPLNGCKEQRARGETRFDPSREKAGAGSVVDLTDSWIKTGSK